MNIGISTACLYPELLEDSLSMLLEKGIKTFEIFINTDSELKEQYLKELNTKIQINGAEVVSLHPFTCGIESMMFFTQYQPRVDDIMEYYRKYFNAMNILGAGIFVFHGNNALNQYEDAMYFERYLALYNLGKEYGITVAQENIARCSSGRLDFLLKMKSQLGKDAGFVLDLKQARRIGADPIEYLTRLGNSIVHIHYSDGDESNECMMFGNGKFNNTKFFDILRQNSFKGCIIEELYRENFKDVNQLSQNYNSLLTYARSM